MNSAAIDRHPLTPVELVLWTVATLVGAFLVPGLGVVIGLVAALTRWRHLRPAVRWSLVVLGAVVLVVQVVGLASGSGDHDVSPITRVA